MNLWIRDNAPRRPGLFAGGEPGRTGQVTLDGIHAGGGADRVQKTCSWRRTAHVLMLPEPGTESSGATGESLRRVIDRLRGGPGPQGGAGPGCYV